MAGGRSAGARTAARRAQTVARFVELRPAVLARMRESVPDELRAGRGAATGRQLQALARLPWDGLTMRELAGFLRVTGAAASVLADRLVAQGLVERRADRGDRRIVRLAPTPEGRAVAALLERLSDDQVEVWLDIMETLAAGDEPGLMPASPGEMAEAAR